MDFSEEELGKPAALKQVTNGCWGAASKEEAQFFERVGHSEMRE